MPSVCCTVLVFAGALAEIGLTRSEIPVALFFFNVGVETGQLLFVVTILAVVCGITRLRSARPELVRAPLAYLIGTVASYWLIERVIVMYSG